MYSRKLKWYIRDIRSQLETHTHTHTLAVSQLEYTQLVISFIYISIVNHSYSFWHTTKSSLVFLKLWCALPLLLCVCLFHNSSAAQLCAIIAVILAFVRTCTFVCAVRTMRVAALYILIILCFKYYYNSSRWCVIITSKSKCEHLCAIVS